MPHAGCLLSSPRGSPQPGSAQRRVGVKLFDFRKNRAWAENIAIVMQLGLTMIGCILFGLWVGRTLDRWLHVHGVFTVLFIILGVVGGGVTAYRQIAETMSSKDSDSRDDENDGAH